MAPLTTAQKRIQRELKDIATVGGLPENVTECGPINDSNCGLSVSYTTGGP